MDISSEYYYGNKKRADSYKLSLDKLINIKSYDCLSMGYCVLIDNAEYGRAFKDKKKIAEGSTFYLYRFIILRLFIDKYRTGEVSLPTVLKHSRWANVDDELKTINENRIAMEILLKPLNTYEDLLARFEDVKTAKELGWDIKNCETFNGYESQEDGELTLNSTKADIQDLGYRVIKPISENVWDIFSIEERSYAREFEIRIYGRQYLHEYLLNLHTSAVL